jgi:hypothetical protein
MKNKLIKQTVKADSNTVGLVVSASVERPLPIVKKGTITPIETEVIIYHFMRLPAG